MGPRSRHLYGCDPVPGGRAAGNAALSLAAQPRFTELFAVGARTEANRIYQATTGWLVSVTWPIYLLAMVYGPQILSVFGRSYQAGAPVMIILAATMLVATACGQVDRC